ncbi:MAG: NAD(P)/FAD-dependent oxidoreductase [Geminicoccaceae bacterium]|jgi:menaquinone-9 beta-reductase
MISVNTIVVGGGPAGSSCAWRLGKRGIECLVLDRAEFPRLKLCAGWVTPQVLQDLEIEPGEYPFSFLTFDALRLSFKGLGFSLRTVQHSIRRIEFDQWLLKRSGAPVARHNVRAIRREGEWYVLDDQYRCRHLVGAGGTPCPVHRTFFREVAPRKPGRQAAVLEEEFACDWHDGTCRLWFFERGLPGYSWYVPKAGGHLNVGVGGMAQKLKAKGDAIGPHWRRLRDKLVSRGLVGARTWDSGGYTYYVRGRKDVTHQGRAYLAGDAAGLATTDLAEGIGPAVRSGIAVAEAIAAGAEPSFAAIGRRSVPAMLEEHGGWPLRIVQRLGWV